MSARGSLLLLSLLLLLLCGTTVVSVGDGTLALITPQPSLHGIHLIGIVYLRFSTVTSRRRKQPTTTMMMMVLWMIGRPHRRRREDRDVMKKSV